MTKQQEIAALDAFIAKLTPHSYLGPWLADNRESIVADITSDCSIDLQLPGAARHTARGIIESAKQDAERTRALASEQANQTRANAQKFCDDQRRAVGDLIAKHAAEAVARLYGRF
ncbi:MAG TPA: hypothetical protein VN903_17265 [Polyangia bacterium]|jgi:phage-related tail protein|nr:hypothetical protein [Polyangia bacterium]